MWFHVVKVPALLFRMTIIVSVCNGRVFKKVSLDQPYEI